LDTVLVDCSALAHIKILRNVDFMIFLHNNI